MAKTGRPKKAEGIKARHTISLEKGMESLLQDYATKRGLSIPEAIVSYMRENFLREAEAINYEEMKNELEATHKEILDIAVSIQSSFSQHVNKVNSSLERVDRFFSRADVKTLPIGTK